jgi:hypothetical protein
MFSVNCCVLKPVAQILLITVALVACSRPKSVPSEEILGKWSMRSVSEYGEDVSEMHNPMHNRWIQFNADGTYESGADTVANSGTWEVDDKNAVLYIHSDEEGDDSEWRISFKENTTTWTGIGHPRKESTTLVHERTQ